MTTGQEKILDYRFVGSFLIDDGLCNAHTVDYLGRDSSCDQFDGSVSVGGIEREF